MGGKAALALLTLRFKAFGLLALGAAAANYFSDPIAQFINVVIEAARKGLPGIIGLLAGGGEKNNIKSDKPPADLNADKNKGTTEGDLNPTEQPEVLEPPVEAPEGTPSLADIYEQQQTQEPEITGIDSTKPPDDLSGTGGPSLDVEVEPITPVMGRQITPDDNSTNFTFDMGFGEIDLNKPVGAEGRTTKIDPETTEMSMVEPVTPVMGREPMTADQLTGNEEEEEAPVNQDIPAQYGEIEMSVNVEPEDVSPEGDTSAGNVPIEGDPSAGLEPGQMTQDDTTFTQMGTSAAEVQSFIEQERYIGRTGQLPADMITPRRRDDSVAQTISRSTEPGVTVVPMPVQQAQSQQQAAPIESPAAQGSVSGVPSIPTSNPDNMYLLGAYSNFNVVPS